MSDHKKAFAKYDLKGEDLAHRILSGAVKASPTEQAYALLWLAERENDRIAEIELSREPKDREPGPTSVTEEALGIARSAVLAQRLAARAALHSARSQEHAQNSARIVNTLAVIAIVASIFVLWSGGQREQASIQKIGVYAAQAFAEMLGQL